MASQPERLETQVRHRLRQLRTERELTLAEVARSAGLDVSTLSRLESGKRRLALDHVPALAAALRVSSDELLGVTPTQDPRVRYRPRRFEGLTLTPLTHRETSGGLRAYKLVVSAARRTPPDPLPVHDGHDWLYVLDGRLRLLLGDAEHDQAGRNNGMTRTATSAFSSRSTGSRAARSARSSCPSQRST